VLFWLAFIIFILALFLFFREVINSSIQIMQNEFSSRGGSGQQSALPLPPLVEIPETQGMTSRAPLEQTPPETSQEGFLSQASQATPENMQGSQGPPAEQVPEPQTELRNRSLYFIQVDRAGSILRVRVDRRLPLSASPMTDALQALLAGPSAEEQGRGLISLIPPETRILSASIRDDTAYISFSEDFQYNSYGVEGYAGQVRQVVLTATEFPNIRNVQILIEGRRIDFLGEGIWIGGPISREML
jgi:spore germination protein GerM